MADELGEQPARIPPPWEVRRRGPARLLAVLALGGFLTALVVLALDPFGHSSTVKAAPTVVATTAPAPTVPKPTTPAPAAPIRVLGIGAYDPPPGDGHENDDLAPKATDGDLTTAWHTENYRNWFKPGVGLVLDAKRPVRATTLTLKTDTPGFPVEIHAGNKAGGPFVRVSPSKTSTATTVFQLKERQSYRYLVVWITRVDGGTADVTEVRVR